MWKRSQFFIVNSQRSQEDEKNRIFCAVSASRLRAAQAYSLNWNSKQSPSITVAIQRIIAHSLLPSSTAMEFTTFSVIVLLIAFVWSGFVRSGLGFGGAGLMYPIAFLAIDSVVFIVPIVGVQLLIFSGITLALGGYKKVDWSTTLKLTLAIMPAYLVGVFGLLNFPEFWLLMLVYMFILLYSLGYMLDYQLKPSAWLNLPIITLGAYIGRLVISWCAFSGHGGITVFTTFTSARVYVCIVVYYGHNQVGDFTLFWGGFAVRASIVVVACCDHWASVGNKVAPSIMTINLDAFYRWMGWALFALSVIGLFRHLG